MNYKVLIWSSQRDLWESYCVKRAKYIDGQYLNGKDLFPTRRWPSLPPCPISNSGELNHTARGQKGMLISKEGKGPQSQTTGKAYCHLPQTTSSCWIHCLWRWRDETERMKKEEGPGQTSSQYKEVTPTQLQPIEKRKRKLHTFTHESFFPIKMWPSKGFKEEYPSSSSGTLPWIVKWSREGVWNSALRTNPPGRAEVAGQVPFQPKP